jgi:hypothetical protein
VDEGEVDSGARAPGGAFYDSPGVFDRYSAHRGEPILSPNLVMEDPAVLDHLGDVAGLRVLDLGLDAGVDLITARLALHSLPDVAPARSQEYSWR